MGYEHVDRHVAATIDPGTGTLYAGARKLDVTGLNADNGIEVQLLVGERSAVETIWTMAMPGWHLVYDRGP